MKIEIDKPTIPQFVAEWLEECKGWNDYEQEYDGDNAIDLFSAMDLDNAGMQDNVQDYLVDNTETFATAWIHGYEVEKEPLYYAKIKGWELTKGESVFWNYRLVIADPMPPRLYTSGKEDGFFVINKMTIEEWNKAGINNTNADFEKVEQ